MKGQRPNTTCNIFLQKVIFVAVSRGKRRDPRLGPQLGAYLLGPLYREFQDSFEYKMSYVGKRKKRKS